MRPDHVNSVKETMSNNQVDPDPRFAATKTLGGDRTWQSTPELRYFAHSPNDPAPLQQQWKCLETGELEWRENPTVTGSTMLNDNQS